MESNAQPESASNQNARHEMFVKLLVEHEPQVRSFLRGLLPTWEDVDEVTQETSLIAWRKFEDFHDGTSFVGWLLTIARFEALKYRRRVARTPLYFSDDLWELLADESVDEDRNQVRRKHLEACLQKLNSAQRDVMLQVHSSGVVMRDVAQQVGKSEQAFYKMIQRLRAVLLNCISKGIAAERTS